jgi:large subunit ribosomal protein L10Ae
MRYVDQPEHDQLSINGLSSKLSVSSVRASIKELLAQSQEKQRKFVETIELQIGLKNYDPQRDKRFSGTVKYVPTPNSRYIYHMNV